jgi:hypothetical protein
MTSGIAAIQQRIRELEKLIGDFNDGNSNLDSEENSENYRELNGIRFAIRELMKEIEKITVSSDVNNILQEQYHTKVMLTQDWLSLKEKLLKLGDKE